MNFTEQSPLERGFGAVFAARVRPELMRIEADRRALHGAARRWMLISLGSAAAIAALVLLAFGFGEGAAIGAILVGMLGAVGALVAWYVHAHRWKASVAGAVMPAVCEFVGDLAYDHSAAAGFPVERARALGMLGSYSSASLSDRVEGRYRDTPFEVVEARLTRRTTNSKGKSSTKTVFRGLLLRIGVPVAAPGRILIARDWGALGNRLAALFRGDTGRGMPKLDTGHEAFEAEFEVFAERPGEAREFLPPIFLDNLLALAKAEGGRRGAKAMVAAFEGDDFFMALSRGGDFLKMGSLGTPVAAMEPELHAIFDDLALVRRIIDRLHGEAPEG